jgi:hypothetical protein
MRWGFGATCDTNRVKMRSKNIQSDGVGNGAESDFINRILERIHKELQFYSSQSVSVQQTTRGTLFKARPVFNPTSAGGFMGEYDSSMDYFAGQTFKITTPLPGVASSVLVGYYGVRPASADVDRQGFGPWAGFLPANPVAAGIDMDKAFFDPQGGSVGVGSAPNDKYYAELIGKYCT